MKKIQKKHSILDSILDSKANADGFDINETIEIACDEEEEEEEEASAEKKQRTDHSTLI